MLFMYWLIDVDIFWIIYPNPLIKWWYFTISNSYIFSCVITNGITHEWFRIPPISDPDCIKETWNSIQRINDPGTSKYLADETRSWQRFLVFAELSGPDYSVFDRERSTIWYSEGDEKKAVPIKNIDCLFCHINDFI